jgi:hypothetical protein
MVEQKILCHFLDGSALAVCLFSLHAPPIHVLNIRLEPEPNAQQQDLPSMLSAQVSRHEQELEEIW